MFHCQSISSMQYQTYSTLLNVLWIVWDLIVNEISPLLCVYIHHTPYFISGGVLLLARVLGPIPPNNLTYFPSHLNCYLRVSNSGHSDKWQNKRCQCPLSKQRCTRNVIFWHNLLVSIGFRIEIEAFFTWFMCENLKWRGKVGWKEVKKDEIYKMRWKMSKIY